MPRNSRLKNTPLEDFENLRKVMRSMFKKIQFNALLTLSLPEQTPSVERCNFFGRFSAALSENHSRERG